MVKPQISLASLLVLVKHIALLITNWTLGAIYLVSVFEHFTKGYGGLAPRLSLIHLGNESKPSVKF